METSKWTPILRICRPLSVICLTLGFGLTACGGGSNSAESSISSTPLPASSSLSSAVDFSSSSISNQVSSIGRPASSVSSQASSVSSQVSSVNSQISSTVSQVSSANSHVSSVSSQISSIGSQVSSGSSTSAGSSTSSSNSEELENSSSSDTSSTWSASSSSVAAPVAPQNLTVIAGDGRITLSWNPVTNADAYDLYFSIEPGVTPDNFASLREGDAKLDVESPYELVGLNNGTSYYMVLVARSQAGGEGLLSDEVSAMPVLPPNLKTGKINDTGISWCRRAGALYLSCPIADRPRQDGDFGRDSQELSGSLSKVGGGAAGFDFTKLDESGKTLPANASHWHCVRDNRTGLIWEVKTNDGSLRDMNHTYTWYNPDMSTNGGNSGTRDGFRAHCEGSECDTYAYTKAVNAQGLCGANDWRVPTKSEYVDLLYLGDGNNYSLLDTNYFPNTVAPPSGISSWQGSISVYWYWTSTTVATSNRLAFVFANQRDKSFAHPLRLVRGN